MSAPTETEAAKTKSGASALHLCVLATITLALMHALGAIDITLLVALTPVLAWGGLILVTAVAVLIYMILAAIVQALAGKADNA